VDFNTAVRKATTIPGLSPAHLAFGDAIRAIRKEQGISQEALALKCSLDRSYYGAVERGERNVSLANIVRVAEALQTPAAIIFARAEALDARGHRSSRRKKAESRDT
jgi:transcriptional regulator with XRE-family HTH domain